MSEVELISLKDLEKAQALFKEHRNFIRRTALLNGCENFSKSIRANVVDDEEKGTLSLKLENMQNLGSFKIRGAFYKMEYSDEFKDHKNLVTMSAGNFGRSFSYLAKERGFHATVVMPDDVPVDRVKAIEGYGAKVALCPRAEVHTFALDIAKKESGKFCHPFDDPELFVGYGTIGLEILEDNPNVDIVVVPIGGGGLVSGISSALRVKCIELGRPHVRVIGVEPIGACSMHQSFVENRPVHLEKIESFANGLAAPYAGENAFKFSRRYLEEVVLVHDDDIRKTMSILYNEYRIVAESAAAASLAAVLSGKIRNSKGSQIVCVLSGGNVSIDELHQQLSLLKE